MIVKPDRSEAIVVLRLCIMILGAKVNLRSPSSLLKEECAFPMGPVAPKHAMVCPDN